MKKFLLLLALFFLTFCSGEASITDVKWGVDAEKNLRLVVDLTEPADFTMDIENRTLVIKVKSALEGEGKVMEVASDFANSLSTKAAGSETVVRVPLLQDIAKEDIKTFTLKTDPVTKRPSRIVVDLMKKKIPPVAPVNQVGNVPTNVAEKQVLPAPKAAPSQAAVQQQAPAQQVAENVQPEVAKQAAEPPRQIAKIPEIKRPQIATSQSATPVVGNTPVRSSAPPAIRVQLPEPKQTSKVGTQSPSATSSSADKVSVGSSPVNKSEIQAKATQKGKDSVKDILTKEKEKKAASVASVAPKVIDVLPMGGGDEKKEEKKEKKGKTNKKGKYRTDGGVKGKVITIDPGHGGSDPGAVSKSGTLEKDITLSMAKKLKEDLEKLGATVYMTRTKDVDVAGKYAEDERELQARVDVAENKRCDLFISLHINASVNHKASGISTYYYPKTKFDKKLASCIHKQLTDNFGLNDMGIREANFYVTKRCYMPAVLMELGFITNAKEEKTIKGNWFQNKAMGLIAKGIKDYFK